MACSLAVLTYVQRQGFIAATPYIKSDLGLDDRQMGTFLAVWLWAYGIFQIPGGSLADWIGARLSLSLLVLLWSVTLAAVALTIYAPAAGAFAIALVLRFGFGAFQAGVFPGVARIVADWMPAQQRGSAQGWIWTFSRIGGAASPILAGWRITQVRGGWAQTLMLLAGVGVAWAIGFWFWFRNRPEDMPIVNQAERDLILLARPPPPPKPEPLPVFSFLSSPSVWGLCLMYGFVGFAGNFITSFLPVYLRDHRHLSDATTGWLQGVPLWAGMISCLSGGAASDWLIRRLDSRKWGRRLVGLVALGLAGVATILTPTLSEVWQLTIVLGAWMFFNDAMLGPAWASCADIGERHAGSLSGAMNMTGAFAGAIGVRMAGGWLEAGHYGLMFGVFAVCYVVAALCWPLVDVTQPLTRSAEELEVEAA